MAKGNPFLGTVSGSFGDLTLKNYRGKQVLTRKSTKPHNPRTSKQIYQRMFFATVGKARAAFKNIIDHSFEQVPHGVDSLNYFQKRNIALLREGTVYDYAKQSWVNPNMNFVAPKSSSFAANPYRISEGSLVPLSNIPAFLTADIENPDESSFNSFKTCLPWVTSAPDDSNNLSEWYEKAYLELELNPGDFLTAVFVSAKDADVRKGSNFPCFIHYVRYKVVEHTYIESGEQKIEHLFMPSCVDGIEFDVPTYAHSDSYGFADTPSLISSLNGDEQSYHPYFDFSTGYSVACGLYILPNEEIYAPFNAPLKNGDIIIAGTWIHSRPEGDRILTSTQNMLMADPTGERIPFNLDLESAFDFWTKQGKAIGDARYLLEGGDV